MDDVEVTASAPANAGWYDGFFVAQRLPMLRLAFVLLDDRAVAEEVVQDAFAQLFARRFEISQPVAFVRSCVLNGCRNQHRRLRVRRRVVLIDRGDAPVGDHVIDAVRQLPYRWRAVVVLRFYGAMTEPEIAETLNIPLGSVKSALHRSLATLRKELEP